MDSSRWAIARRVRLWALLAALLALVPVAIAAAQTGQWVVGQDVGLRKGTAIRQGPGLSFPAHTCVPEDNWTVRVTGGPTYADGKTWYDTSRNAAGDPSGGTGWVDASQTDMFDPATGACPALGVIIPPAAQDWWNTLFTWWSGQSMVVKIAVAVLVLMVLLWLWRQVGGGVMSLLRAVLLAVVLWLVLDATRQYWQPTWFQLGGNKLPDLPLIVAALPLLGWVLSLLGLSRRNRY